MVGPAWVGDMVMTQALYITLLQRFPGARIDVLAPAWSVPLIERMPEVDEAIVVPIGHGEFGLGKRVRLGRQLRGRRYDRAIVTPRSFKAALIPFLTGARIRTGYRGELRYGLLNDIRALDKSRLAQTVQRYVALGLPRDAVLPPPIPKPRLMVDETNRERVMTQLKLERSRPIIGFMPGAEYGPAKQWPAQHYRDLAVRLVREGYQVWIFGSGRDHDIAQQIAAGLEPDVHNLCGHTRLVDAVDLIASCDTVVTNDSGLMHVAAAVGRPLAAIYGSSSPGYTPPLSDDAAVFYLGLECSPCFKRECPLGNTECLNGISVDDVFTRCMVRLSNDHSSF